MSVLEWPKNDRFSDHHTSVATAFASSRTVAITAPAIASPRTRMMDAGCERY